MVSGGITQIKNAINSGKFPVIYLIKGTDHKARVILPNREDKEFKAKAKEVIEALESDFLPSGNYTVVFKSKYASPKPAAEYGVIITDGHATTPMAEQPTDLMERSEEMQLREELVRLRLENEQLKKEIEADDLEEGPDPSQTITTVAETVKGILSEVVVPIISKYMEQRERKVQALEAAATAAAYRPPVAVAPAPTFQIRPGYTATARPAPAPTPAAPAAGTPGSGGQAAPQEPEMTESEYMEAVKHLEFEELQTQYQLIKARGNKVDLAYFLAMVREARPDDLVPLIDQDMKGGSDE